MKQILSVALIGASLLLAPASLLRADDHDRAQRYYDRDARDWHDWNDNEQRAYRRYYQDQHRNNQDWPRTSRAQQRGYWRWRHQHSDESLWNRDRTERPRTERER